MTPTVRRYINAALYTATGVVTTFARLHFLAAHPVAQEIVGWVPVLLALAGIGFHLATGDESLSQSAVEVAKRVAVIALLVAFPARAQVPVLAGDVVRVEAVADPGVDAGEQRPEAVEQGAVHRLGPREHASVNAPDPRVGGAALAPDPLHRGDALALEPRADGGSLAPAPRASDPPVPPAVPPGAANLSTPVCTPTTSKPVPLWAQVIGWAAAAIVEGATLAVTIMQMQGP